MTDDFIEGGLDGHSLDPGLSISHLTGAIGTELFVNTLDPLLFFISQNVCYSLPTPKSISTTK